MFWTNFFIDALLVVFVVACPLMCLIILMQRSKQEGLGAAFGGGITESMWGAQTSNVLVRATVVLAATFFIVCIGLARLYAYRVSVMERPSSLQQQLMHPIGTTNAPAATLVPMTATNAAGTSLVPTATPAGSAPLVSPRSTPATPAPAK